MNRSTLSTLLCHFAAALAVAAAAAVAPAAWAKPKPASKPAQEQSDKSPGKGKAKSHSLGKYGDWEALTTIGKDKTCYALGAPVKRQPEGKLKDAAANIFITTRPGEGVHNEVAIGLGYPTKENGAASADIDGDGFELVTTGTNAWLKNAAKEKEFVEAMKGGAKLQIKASSAKGTSTTDTYSLKGLSDALARVQQECE
jgi:invasion protein IalB